MSLNEREKQIVDLLLKNSGRRAFYHVEPRYSSGSPAMVNIGICAHVAAQEEEAFARNLTGVYGGAAVQRAQNDGLAFVAYARWEAKGKVWRYDPLTNVVTVEQKRLSHDERVRAKEPSQDSP